MTRGPPGPPRSRGDDAWGCGCLTILVLAILGAVLLLGKFLGG